MKTILITGCSSGFGLAIARYFLDRDWKVVATMRTPRVDVLAASDHLRILPLDVTDPESIRQAVDNAGPIDALINNAGIGMASPFELTTPAQARELIETNTIGTLALTQAVLPQFRQRHDGVIVNITSSVTLKALPLVSVYSASKAAVNAFTESMAIELEPHGIRVRLVLPGRAPGTRFGDNAKADNRLQGMDHDAYADFMQRAFAEIVSSSGPITHAEDVAEATWRAVTDPSSPMRIPAGADAVALVNTALFREKSA